MGKEATSKSAVATMKALIVDDEKLAADELAYLLKDHPEVEIVGVASNGPEAIEQIGALEPDIVFLDVQMPGLDGLSVARELLASGGGLPHIIFATAFDQYAVAAFEVNAADYLLKPIDKQRLAVSIERARKQLRAPHAETGRMEELLSQIQRNVRSPTKLLVRHQNRMILVDADEVIYATIQDGVISIAATTIQGQSSYRTIEDLQSNLDERTFWRAHRSYLVNINRIKEVVPWFKSSYQLRMSDKAQTEIPVSRAQTKRLRELFKI